MAAALTMPRLGQSMVEGTVAAWLQAEGDEVALDAPLVTVSTEKIDTDLPAPEAGVVLRICVEPGTTVAVGTPLAYVGSPGEELPPLEPPERAAPAREPVQESAISSTEPRPAGDTGQGFLSPVVARMLQEHGLEPASIQGTGRNGRITRKDVAAAASRQREAASAAGTRPLTPMRRAIAEHMIRSVRESPHVTTFFEVDVAEAARQRSLARREMASRGVKLSLLPFFMRAAVEGLRKYPELNASLREDRLVLHAGVHLGIAVAVPNGLVVPVIRHAERLNLEGLARALTDVADRARNRALKPEDMEGGTFSITNHGATGSMAATPIIHQPHAAVLGVGSVTKRPVVRAADPLLPHADDAIVVRPMCVLSLSFDHRILDGAAADGFLTCVRDRLARAD